MTIEELSKNWVLEIIPDAVEDDYPNYLTLVGAYAYAYETCSRYWHSKQNRAQTNAYLNNVILPALEKHNSTPISAYTREDFESAINRIKEQGKARSRYDKYEPYADSTIQRFRNILARIFQGCSEMGLCENIFKDTYFLTDPDDIRDSESAIVLVKKSLSLETEFRLIDYLLSDYKTDGETIGFLLVVACGLRIIESTAAVFGNIIPLQFHPDCFMLLVYETGIALSNQLKSSGKTHNANRAIPFFDRVVQFLNKRMEYVGEELKKLGIDADVSTLPIVCSGRNYMKGCTTKQISDKAREIFSRFGVTPTIFQSIDAAMTYGDLKEIREKNPTGYLGRHIFATHLAICDLTESEIQAVIGHEIEDRRDIRNDFSHEEIIYSIKKKMDRLPLYRSHEHIVNASDISGTISGRGPIQLQIDKPLEYLHISVECEEPLDSLTIDVSGDSSGQLITGFKSPPLRTGVDVMSKYEEIYELHKQKK